MDIEGAEIIAFKQLIEYYDIINNIIMEWHYELNKFYKLAEQLNLEKYYDFKINNKIIKLIKK